jgi:ABC-type cobalamin transport system permease subunit
MCVMCSCDVWCGVCLHECGYGVVWCMVMLCMVVLCGVCLLHVCVTFLWFVPSVGFSFKTQIGIWARLPRKGTELLSDVCLRLS